MRLAALAFGCVSTPGSDATREPWTVWPDVDLDGYGAQVEGRVVTKDLFGWVDNRGDCDDSDPRVNPDGVDQCVGGLSLDFDCSGHPDNQVGSEMCRAEFTGCPFHADEDGDQYGGLVMVVYGYMECWFPEDVAGYVGREGDCDDADPTVHPEAFELCDTVDNDCDTRVDEGC